MSDWDKRRFKAFEGWYKRQNWKSWECRLSREGDGARRRTDRKSTRLNSSHQIISYAVFCLKKKNISVTSWATTKADGERSLPASLRAAAFRHAFPLIQKHYRPTSTARNL